MAHILLRHRDVPHIHELDVYLANGGYEGLKKALKMSPEEVTAEVRAANVRGRGGAGFPAGVKWGFIPKAISPKYIIINTDESETGTFKDRELVEKNPHQVIEGALIAAYAVGSELIFNYFRGEYMDAAYNFEEALKECYANGLVGQGILDSDFNCDFYCHYGAGAYICGEDDTLATPNAETDYDRTSVPVYMTVMDNVDHMAAAREGLPAICAWMLWHLSDETSRQGDFLNSSGEFQNGIHDAKAKNW